MMKFTTFVLAILVMATVYPAWIVQPETPSDGLRAKEGQLIGREGRGAEDVRELELITWDESRGRAARFTVVYDRERGWIIPSHHDYPADATEQVGRTAGSVLGKRFGPLVSDDPKQFARLGVLDPGDEATSSETDGHGTRITLRDEAGAEIIDLIIGNRDGAKAGSRFVREKGSDAVYSVEINVLFSTRFTDWVNRKLIEVTSDDIRKLRIDRYAVDERTGQLNDRTTHTLARTDGAAEWAVGGSVPKGQVVDSDVVDELIARVANLQLQGVRPLVAQEGYLQRHGLFRGNDQQLYGNEGALFLTTDEGIQYGLYFGEVAPGEGLALSAGLDGDTADGGDDLSADDNRYLAIIADYDPNADSELREAMQAPAAGLDGQEGAEEENDETETEDGPADPEAIKQRRIERVNELNDRYLAYFYVIDNASFYELRPDAETLFTEPEAEAEQEEGAAAPQQGLPAPPALPGN